MIITLESESLKKHAKSFYLASLFFPRNIFKKVRYFYSICRAIDNSVDQGVKEQREESLASLEENLKKSTIPEISYFSQKNYLNDLVCGAKFDLGFVRIKTKNELVEYSYLVAGSVGLAMCDIMEINSKFARPFAVDLGIAMQITNICRDVLEDAKNNRVYIPDEILLKYNLTQDQILSLNVDANKVKPVIIEMLNLADEFYASARKGFCYIPWRSRISIIIAAHLYQNIGFELKKQNYNPFLGRVHVGFFKKIYLVVISIFQWLFMHKRKVILHEAKLHEALLKFKDTRGLSI